MSGGCGRCGARVRYVVIRDTGKTVAVELVAHDRGTIAVPNSPNASKAYELAHETAPAAGHTRHRRHTCTKEN